MMTNGMKSENIRAGTKQVMTHVERQKFLKESELGRKLGVRDILQERFLSDLIEELEKLKEEKGNLKIFKVEIFYEQTYNPDTMTYEWVKSDESK